ncbi:hypothetical protein V6N13_014062 [Hibiscus sabdariffa]|uniref:Uncharacterized protein n=1 Tax=Hibiscus sabdariffa TaxID=183260 RepID=A0ABR2RUA5_9ROSI
MCLFLTPEDPYDGQQSQRKQNPPLTHVNQSTVAPSNPTPPPVTEWRPHPMSSPPPLPHFMSTNGAAKQLKAESGQGESEKEAEVEKAMRRNVDEDDCGRRRKESKV